MKNRILLTSLVAIFAVGPALAANGDSVTGTGNECVQGVIGVTEGSASITGNWIAHTFKVTFDKNNTKPTSSGTTSGSKAQVTCTYDVACDFTNNPTTAGFSRVGHTFSGWNTSDAGTGTAAAATNAVHNEVYTANAGGTAGNDVTLYAQWTPNVYDITLNDNSGSGGSGHAYEKYATGWYSNSAATTAFTNNKVTAPTRSGYTFRGYYTGDIADVSASTSSTTNQKIKKDGTLPANTTFTADTTLKAGWAKNCTIPDHGSCTLSVANTGTVTYTTSCDVGWTISGNATATPTCTANSITLNWYNDSTSQTADTTNTCTYNSTVTLPSPEPTKTGYSFNGWTVGH